MMIEVSPGLWVGDQAAFMTLLHDEETEDVGEDFVVPTGWAVVHAAKEPYHRSFVGYMSRGAPVTSPEYYTARRGWRLALNMVDTPDPAFIRDELVERALAFISEARAAGRKVLVHCKHGHSRAPGLALLWLRRNEPPGPGLFPAYSDPKMTADDAQGVFRDDYPDYAPGEGIRGYLAAHWDLGENHARREGAPAQGGGSSDSRGDDRGALSG